MDYPSEVLEEVRAKKNLTGERSDRCRAEGRKRCLQDIRRVSRWQKAFHQVLVARCLNNYHCATRKFSDPPKLQRAVDESRRS